MELPSIKISKFWYFSIVWFTGHAIRSDSIVTRFWTKNVKNSSNQENQNTLHLKCFKLYFCFEMRNFILELKIRLKWNSKILSRVLSFYWIKKSNFPFMWNRSFTNKLELGRINRNTRTGNVKTSKTSEKCQNMPFLFQKFRNSKQ